MEINIPENLEKGNPSTMYKVFWPVLLLVVTIGSYGLGKMNKIYESRVPISITPVVGTTSPLNLRGEEKDKAVTSSKIPRRVYVAARGGTVYYLPTCAAANRIAEKNKIWFETKEEAERLGYKPAQNCKGL